MHDVKTNNSLGLLVRLATLAAMYRHHCERLEIILATSFTPRPGPNAVVRLKMKHEIRLAFLIVDLVAVRTNHLKTETSNG